jgi:WD40 repeat protein
MPVAQTSTGGSGAPLYFICYSRTERDLVAKIEAKLAARRRRGEIDLWRDVRNLDVWEQFTPEILRVLAEAAGAIVVVSDTWSLSNYIQEHEWPTVQARRAGDPAFGVFLLAVHDLDSDDPLRERNFVNNLSEELLVAVGDATRDRVLTRLSDLIGTHARTRSTDTAPAPGARTAIHRVEPAGRLEAGRPAPASQAVEIPAHQHPAAQERPAAPDGLPTVPEQFVEPAELAELAGWLAADRTTDPTAEPTAGLSRAPAVAVGLCGEGGTGKSMLAGAVARRVAGAFPDGAHWATVGEQASSEDVRRVQAELLHRLRPDDGQPRDVNHGKEMLAAALGDTAMLLVVDDVWHPWQSRAFDVLRPGARSRILFTTRFVEALPAGSGIVELDRLPAEQATAFLARLPLGVPADPDDLTAVLDAAGGLRLALAVLAATARVEGGWPAVLSRLPGLSARFGKGDDASSAQKALFVAVDTLEPPDRRRVLGLGSFPPDTAIPAAVLAEVWSLSSADANGVLDRLVAKGIAVRAGDGVQLHDHVHDFLVLQATESAADVHLRLWELAQTAAADGWATLADRTPYLWDHLVWHACRAGLNRATLRRMAGDLDRLAERIRRQGAAAAEADVAAVCQVTAVGQDEPLSLLGRVLRHGALFQAAGQQGDLLISLQAWADAIGLERRGERRLRYGSLPVPSARLRGTLRGHTADLWAVAVSPDGGRLATGSGDGTARIWDTDSGEQRLVLTAVSPIWDVTFSPDGSRIAAGCADGTIWLWDSTGGDGVGVLHGHADEVWSVAFSPDGGRLAAAGADGTASVWELVSGERRQLLGDSASPPIWAVAFTPDGERLATAGRDRAVRFWDLNTGAVLNTLRGHTDQIRTLAISRDGGRLASGADDGTARLWDARTGEPMHVLHGHGEAVWAVAFDPTGSRLASAGFDGTARIWDVESGGQLAELQGHSNAVHDVAFGPEGERLLTCGADTTARIWDVTDLGPPGPSQPQPGRVYGIAVSHDLRLIATAHADGRATLCDAQTGERLRDLTWHRASVWGIGFSPDDARLATTSWDGTVRVWDVATGRELHVLAGHRHQVWDVAHSPDGRLLASAGEDATIRLWDAGSGAAGQVLTGHARQVRAVAFDPDGRLLASVGDDGTVRLWEVATGLALRIITGHRGQVWDVAFAAAGRTLVSCGEDGTVRLWDVGTGDPVRSLTGHTGPVWHLALSPDGRHLASSGGDGAARIWHLESEQCILTLALACAGPVAWLGNRLAVGAGGSWAMVELPAIESGAAEGSTSQRAAPAPDG